MDGLVKRKLQLQFIPEELASDFEEFVFGAYFDEGVHGLKDLTYAASYFSVYRHNYLETGNPYSDLSVLLGNKGDKIRITDADEIRKDVQILLEFKHMFYAKDIHPTRRHYIDCRNIPVGSVW
jgi:hypothetical protein